MNLYNFFGLSYVLSIRIVQHSEEQQMIDSVFNKKNIYMVFIYQLAFENTVFLLIPKKNATVQ
jgi:hypothetical protein